MAPDLVPTAAKSGAGLTKPVTLPRRAYVTFLAGNGDYVKGVVGLAKGLRRVKTAYPLVVAVLPDVPEEHCKILHSQGCIVREIQPVYPPQNNTHFAMAYYVINYSKLRIWEFVEYSKMIYLDGDIQVYENIDHLFDLPDGKFYAVMDCFCEKTWSHTPQYKVGYCQQCPEKVKWPTELGPPPSLYFNAGMFVFEPGVGTYQDLLKTVQVTTPTSFAEQDFLNMYFKKIYTPIPLNYNLVLAMLWRHPENVKLEEVKVVHYCAAGSKPWRYTGKEENMQREDIKMLVKKWRCQRLVMFSMSLPPQQLKMRHSTNDNKNKDVKTKAKVMKTQVTKQGGIEIGGRICRQLKGGFFFVVFVSGRGIGLFRKGFSSFFIYFF